MDTVGSFSMGEAAGAWSSRLISTKCRGELCVEIYVHFPSRREL